MWIAPLPLVGQGCNFTPEAGAGSQQVPVVVPAPDVLPDVLPVEGPDVAAPAVVVDREVEVVPTDVAISEPEELPELAADVETPAEVVPVAPPVPLMPVAPDPQPAARRERQAPTANEAVRRRALVP